MALPQNARFEEAFNRSRAWNTRAPYTKDHNPGSFSPNRGQHVPLPFAFGHGQQSSVSSQSSFASEDSAGDQQSPPPQPQQSASRVYDDPQAAPMYRNASNPLPASSASGPASFPQPASHRPTNGLKSLKLGSSSSRSVLSGTRQNSQSSSASSPSGDTPDTSAEDSALMSSASSTASQLPYDDPSYSTSTPSMSGSKGHGYHANARSRLPFQRSQSDNTPRAFSAERDPSGPSAALYRSALSRHARNQSTDSAGSGHSDDAPSNSQHPSSHASASNARSATKSPPASLETLDLSHKKIDSFSLELIQSLTGSVERLALGYNRLQSLPRQFASLGSTLRYLNIRTNAFTVFPTILCEMPSLEILDISRNKIEALPERCGTLKHLKVLSVCRNRITALPAYFADMTDLKVLKLDHNPLEWPPREVVSMPGSSSASQDDSSSISSKKQDDPKVMQKWLLALQQYIRQHRPSPSLDADVVASPESSDSVLPLRPTINTNLAFPAPRQMHSPTGPATTHVRNASATASSAAPRIGSRPELRSKKSLPELRIGQTPTAASMTPSSSQASSSQSQSPVMPSPSGAVRFNEVHHPRPGVEEGRERGKAPMIERNSGAYFRRLSMLPANTASKALPHHVLETVDGIRSILFSLSQVYSALKQFLVFATQERLPVALTKLMTSADNTMGDFINALDRFDSFSRRRQGADGPQVCRDVLTSCQESIAVYGKLVRVMQIQLKVLTGSADSRYIRTLLLMLHGSMGEIAIAWGNMTKHSAAVAEYIAVTPESKPSHSDDAAVFLQPATPSPQVETPASPFDLQPERARKGSEQSMKSESSKPPSADILTARARRHAGSFSVEDVQLGAVMPPAPHGQPPPPVPPTPSLPSSPPISASGGTLPIKPPGSMRPRPGAPKLATLPPGPGYDKNMPYMDLMATLEGLPPTPQTAALPTATPGPLHRSQPSSSSASMLRRESQQAKSSSPPGPTLPNPPKSSASSVTAVPPRSGSVSASGRAMPSYAAKPLDPDFLEIVEQTTNVAFSVCNMLVEDLSDSDSGQRSKQTASLLELCDITSENARRLNSTLDNAKRAESGQSSDVMGIAHRHLSDECNIFARAVVQCVKLAKDLSTEVMFAKPIREGLSQLAKSTNSLVALLAATYGK